MIHTGLVGNTERKEILEDLTTRGLFQDSTDQTALKERLNEGPITLYCGFDPTADSLHLGHLVPLLTLRRFQDAGHRPIALAGGATGMVGDPSGRSEERNLLDQKELSSNVESVAAQLEAFLSFDAESKKKGTAALLVDNREWTVELNVLDLVTMIELIINQSSVSYEAMSVIDINQDNNFNILDIVVFVQLIVGS